MIQSFINALHVFVCLFLLLVVLLQQSKGGGLGGAIGGGAAQVFGGRGAGNFMTRTTGVAATLFMLTSMSLAYLSSAGDREMKSFDLQQEDR
ncbi:MAG: preprotein translocase subunit SecG [Deltaproteobacteria bacterium]|nr:preprotein translocase subunit SecG [Deltaproteobacteria bacterium]